MKVIIIILQAILNLVRKRRDLIANRSKIPPEYRDDVVVWYSPKKQRLTNYDVIESYAEDFSLKMMFIIMYLLNFKCLFSKNLLILFAIK